MEAASLDSNSWPFRNSALIIVSASQEGMRRRLRRNPLQETNLHKHRPGVQGQVDKTMIKAADNSGNYSITVPLVPGTNTFQVSSSDAFGQKITGTIAPV